MSFLAEVRIYAGRIRQFTRADWHVYLAWVGLMLGLVFSTGGFLVAGHLAGISFPDEAWLVPIGAAVFSAAIAFDTIGHRTVYREALAGGERLVHHITIFAGVGSCVLLCAAYDLGVAAAIPALVLTALSFLYSVIDEAFHWRRYANGRTDRVEMWSHVFIFVGHLTMMIGWWLWYLRGYAGVADTVALLRS